eukprot:2808875-Lingulodinium_polyedra.AAC.1
MGQLARNRTAPTRNSRITVAGVAACLRYLRRNWGPHRKRKTAKLRRETLRPWSRVRPRSCANKSAWSPP